MGDLDGLVPWLHEQLNADERSAQLAINDEFLHSGRWNAHGPYGDGGSLGLIQSDQHEQIIDADLPWPLAQHVADHDPARALRAVEAKRAVLKMHAPVAETCDTCSRGFDSLDWGPKYPCETVRHLATEYADRPGYREEWRP